MVHSVNEYCCGILMLNNTTQRVTETTQNDNSKKPEGKADLRDAASAKATREWEWGGRRGPASGLRHEWCAAWGRRLTGNCLRALGSLLEGDGLLLAHGGDDSDEEILAAVKLLLDLFAEVAIGQLDVVLGDAVLGHQVEEAVVDVDLCGVLRENKPVSSGGRKGGPTSWYSLRETLGTSMLWVEGQISSCIREMQRKGVG